MKILEGITIIIIGIILFLANILAAFAAFDCELKGNYYDCTQGNTLSGQINTGSYGLYIHDMNISIVGASGTSDHLAGSNAELELTSTYKIKIENITLNLLGGNGYRIVKRAGGEGGSAYFSIYGNPLVEINNTKINLTGGVGADGYADCHTTNDTSCSHSASEVGGAGGIFRISMIATNVTTNNFNVTGKNGMSGDSDADCVNGDTQSENGVSSNTSYILINSSTYSGAGVFSLTGGNGGIGDYCEGKDGNGGNGGDIILNISSTNAIFNDNITAIAGNGAEGVAGGDGEANGGNGGSIYFLLDSKTITSNFKNDFRTGIPAPGETGEDNCFGGYHGIFDIRFIGTNISLKGFMNYTHDATVTICDDNAGTGDRDCNARNGKNDTILINANDTVNFDVVYYQTGTMPQDSGAPDDGNGGNAGTINFTIYSTNTVLNNSNFQIVSMRGGIAQHSDSTNSIEGKGGNINYNIYGLTSITNSVINLTSGNSGTGGSVANDSGASGKITYSQTNSTNIDNTSIYLTGGLNDLVNLIDGSMLVSFNNLTFNNSKLQMITGLGSVTSNLTLLNVSNYFDVINSDLFIKSAGNGTCKPAEMNLNNVVLFRTYNSNFTFFSNNTCNSTITATGEEFDLLNTTKFNFTSTSGFGKTSFTLSSSRVGLPGISVWNYSEVGRPNIVLVNGITSYNTSRGYRTLSGNWTWNHTTTNLVYDDFFSRIQDTKFQKVSSDKGPDMYDYTNFTCATKIDLGDYMIEAVKINFTIYNGTSSFATSNAVTIVDNQYVNATFQINGTNTNIGEVWNCSIKVYDSTFNKANHTLKTINYTYPYNVSIWIGNNKVIAGSYTNDYLINNLNITLDRQTINEYIQNNCTIFPCNVPIEFRSDTIAKINVTNLNISIGISNPINTSLNSTYLFPLIFTSTTEGNLTAQDAYFVYHSTEETNITIRGTTSTQTFEKIISVIYSKFNLTINPKGVKNYDVYPATPNSKNVQPFGQTKTMGIYNITRGNGTTYPFEVRMKISNGTGNNCTTIWFSTNNTKSQGFNLSELNYTYISMITTNTSTSLWSWVDFTNCNSTDVAYFFPDFIIKSKATGTVNTTNFWVD